MASGRLASGGLASRSVDREEVLIQRIDESVNPQAVSQVANQANQPEPPRAAFVITEHNETGFLGQSDSDVLETLRYAEVVDVERGRGGRSLGFKLTFADGSRAYFKPEQTFSGANYYAEIAAYHLDRLLGLGRVPPTVGRRLPYRVIANAAAGDSRVHELITHEGADGVRYINGAMIQWIETRLVPIRPGRGWERWIRVEPIPGLTPFQRPVSYAQLARGEELHGHGIGIEGDLMERSMPPAGEPDTENRPEELSNMILFDFLTMNIDRWGGGFTNIRTVGERGPLIYLDNGAAFIEHRERYGFMDRRLSWTQRFSRPTLESIRTLDVSEVGERTLQEGLGDILPSDVLTTLEQRRAHLLRYVDAEAERLGNQVWF